MRACTNCTLLVTAALSCILISISQQPAHGWQFPDAEPIEGARKGVKPPEFSPKQWRVNTTGGLLTIFMPVIPTEMELGYARNQLRTFERLFDLSTIREWMIVTPPDHVEDVRVSCLHASLKYCQSTAKALIKVQQDLIVPSPSSCPACGGLAS